MKPQIQNRLKSFAWRAVMMLLAGLTDVAIASLSDFNLTGEQVVFAGLILGEVSKYFNSKK